MDKEGIKEALYNRYIVPTLKKKDEFVGIEIEIPIVNLSGEATDFKSIREAVNCFCHNFGFEFNGFDENGNGYSATEPLTGDNLSFDCSFNNLEFSFAKERNLKIINERFNLYINSLNEKLESYNSHSIYHKVHNPSPK